MKKQNNIFVEWLGIWDVKHISSLSNQYSSEYPYHDTFFGLAKMLSVYENIVVHFLNMGKDIIEIKKPFIANIREFLRWKNQMGCTTTVLVKGYFLPDIYNI